VARFDQAGRFAAGESANHRVDSAEHIDLQGDLRMLRTRHAVCSLRAVLEKTLRAQPGQGSKPPVLYRRSTWFLRPAKRVARADQTQNGNEEPQKA